MDPELDALLGRICDEAEAAHPGLALDRAAFVQALMARLPPEAVPAETLASLRTVDLYLACASATGEPAALARFEPLLSREVEDAARAVRAPAGLADEVKQRLREHLLVGDAERGPAIADYAGRGDLSAFVRISAVRECLRLMKRQAREIGVEEDELGVLAPAVDPELERLKQTYRQEFAACFSTALAALPPRERTLLRMSVLDRVSIDKIGAIYGVHRATAARWLERARTRIAEHTESLLGERLALETGEVASVIRLVRSQLDVSLERLLATGEKR